MNTGTMWYVKVLLLLFTASYFNFKKALSFVNNAFCCRKMFMFTTMKSKLMGPYFRFPTLLRSIGVAVLLTRMFFAIRGLSSVCNVGYEAILISHWFQFFLEILYGDEQGSYKSDHVSF